LSARRPGEACAASTALAIIPAALDPLADLPSLAAVGGGAPDPAKAVLRIDGLAQPA